MCVRTCVCVCGIYSVYESALRRRRFTKPARAFTDGKLADGQGGRPSIDTVYDVYSGSQKFVRSLNGLLLPLRS